MNGLNSSFLRVEASEDLPGTCMPDSVKHLLEVYGVVEQITPMLQVLLSDGLTIEDLCSLESFQDNLEYDLAGMVY